ncbi:MAG: Uma2 family endonuclease [Lachnospiraceae bacterium]|nr:Uma2 family endonuclease [Lachnospiraceae bacterium]
MNADDIRRRKKALKLTTKELAYRAELPVSTVSKIMTGETRNPSYVTLEKLDLVIMQEEADRRIEAYLAAMEEYIKAHPDTDFDQTEFDRIYREENRLDNAPIPLARPLDEPRESIGNLAYRMSGMMSLEEYSALGESRIYELLNGQLTVNDHPKVRHQRIISDVGRTIGNFISDRGGSCEVFIGGINVRFPGDDSTNLIPDIAVICDPDILDETGTTSAPDWIIEVTSPATRKRDYNEKRSKYMKNGVREYWVIDLEKEAVSVYLAENPDIAGLYGFGTDIPVNIYNGDLKIQIEKPSE